MCNLLYDGFLKIELIESLVKGKVVSREKLLMKDSVAGILKNELGKYCLVKQYRPVVGSSFYEIPAGICDKVGLSHKEILIEEIEEECEIFRDDILSIELLTDYYMSIGFSDAKLYLYNVLIKGNSSGVHLVNDTDVDSIIWVDFNELTHLYKSGQIKDNKTILIYYYLLSNQI